MMIAPWRGQRGCSRTLSTIVSVYAGLQGGPLHVSLAMTSKIRQRRASGLPQTGLGQRSINRDVTRVAIFFCAVTNQSSAISE